MIQRQISSHDGAYLIQKDWEHLVTYLRNPTQRFPYTDQSTCVHVCVLTCASPPHLSCRRHYQLIETFYHAVDCRIHWCF